MSEKKLKVLILQPWISWRGAERTSIQLAVQLKECGHSVKVAAFFIDKRNLPSGAEKVDYLLPAKVFRNLCQKCNFFLFFEYHLRSEAISLGTSLGFGGSHSTPLI